MCKQRFVEMKFVSVLVVLFIGLSEANCAFLRLKEGIVKGRIAPIPNSEKTFYAFQQIPYAAAPIGNLRFQPPQPAPKWNGILDATKNSKICYQMPSDSNEETEDCLYLNVYTPELPSKQRPVSIPVMVYFHGGGYILGDGTYQSYGPDFLVDHDVIIVTLNYRLGPFGFLSTQDDIIPGNYGLKDQRFALQWVNRNIHLFGGNASEVTIFGQSAGASSVGYHLLDPKSKDLYRAAIMESSTSLCPFGYQRYAKHYAFTIASLINSSITANSSSKEVLQTMLQASATDIDQASKTVLGGETYDNAQLFQGYYYAPVIEPESKHAILTEKMYEVVSTGKASKVPIILGINSEESLSQTSDLQFMKGLMSLFDNDPKALAPKDMNIDSDTIRANAGVQIIKIYSGDDLLENVPAAGFRYMSDTAFTRPVIKHALLQSEYSNVYFYQFSYDGLLGNVSFTVEGAERVGHNEELGYLWRLQNEIIDNYDLSIFPESDITTLKRLLTLWTTFAKTLNPTPARIDLLQNVSWPTVLPNNNFPFLDIGEDLVIRNHPKNESFAGWSSVYETFGVEPYDTY